MRIVIEARHAIERICFVEGVPSVASVYEAGFVTAPLAGRRQQIAARIVPDSQWSCAPAHQSHSRRLLRIVGTCCHTPTGSVVVSTLGPGAS